MQLDFTLNTIFSFTGPNLSLLGNEADFRRLAQEVAELTDPDIPRQFEVNALPFIRATPGAKVLFASSPKAYKLCIIEGGILSFVLDARYWERLFMYFALMSWEARTYYLNSDEAVLSDLDLEQECHFICSSGYPHLSKSLKG